MTLDIEQIKARVDRATPGPWSHFQTMSGQYYIGEANDDDAPIASMHQGFDEQDRNAAFIAHARTDIPNLIAEVERLQAELEDLRAMLDRLANARIGSEGDTDYGVRLAGEIDEGQ